MGCEGTPRVGLLWLQLAVEEMQSQIVMNDWPTPKFRGVVMFSRTLGLAEAKSGLPSKSLMSSLPELGSSGCTTMVC